MLGLVFERSCFWTVFCLLKMIPSPKLLLDGKEHERIHLNYCHVWVAATGSDPITFVWNRILNHLTRLVKWLGYVVSTYLHGASTVCFYHVTYVFRQNLRSAVDWMSRNSLFKAGVQSMDQHTVNTQSMGTKHG